MHKLLDYVCDEMDDLDKKAEKGKLSMSEIEYADKLAHLKKNILRSDELMGEGYSSRPYMDYSRRRDSRYSRDYDYDRYTRDDYDQRAHR